VWGKEQLLCHARILSHMAFCEMLLHPSYFFFSIKIRRKTHLGWVEMGCEKPFRIPFLSVAYFASSTKHCTHTSADKGSLEIRPKPFFQSHGVLIF